MSATAELAPAPAAVVIERRLPHTPERVWHMLTNSASIAKWLMPNDFAAVPGHRFTLRAPCATEWDGVIRCEVLEIEPPRRLRYSWVSGSDREVGMAAPLDSWVCWTLEPVQGGTMLRMEHAGFGPGNETVHAAVTQGWPGKLDLLDGLLAEG